MSSTKDITSQGTTPASKTHYIASAVRTDTNTHKTGGFTTESAIKRSSADTSSQIPGEVTTWPNKDERPKSTTSRFPAGVFMGGVATGAVIVILSGLSMYFLVIRRRYDLTAKKHGHTPAPVEHVTYSGLSSGTDTNNYATIEQPTRSEEDSTRRTTATPDYQNI